MGVYKRKDRGGRKGTYYASYVDADGKQQKFNTGTTDKQTAEQILAHRKTEVAKRKGGIVNADADRLAKHSKTPLTEHVDAYIATMKARGRTANYVDATKKHIEAVIAFAGWTQLSNIDADDVTRYAAELKTRETGDSADRKALGKGRAHRTISSHLQSIKGFTRWLAGAGGRLPMDPLRLIKKPNSAEDRRLVRRAMTVEEWRILKRLMPDAGLRFDTPADERLLLYETAIQTALRSNELRSLGRGRLHLSGKQKFVLVPSRSTKNKKDARQFVSADLAKRLAAHVKKREPGAPVFSLPHPTDMADMLRADLAFARGLWIKEAGEDAALKKEREQSTTLADVDDEKERLDFHALRHTAGAWLALAGVHPKAIQSIMRHSDIKLTLDTYGHLFPSTEADAIDKLARMVGGEDPHDISEASS